MQRPLATMHATASHATASRYNACNGLSQRCMQRPLATMNATASRYDACNDCEADARVESRCARQCGLLQADGRTLTQPNQRNIHPMRKSMQPMQKRSSTAAGLDRA
eukprot:1374938-Pleurochrysis_carterae.AAC.1